MDLKEYEFNYPNSSLDDYLNYLGFRYNELDNLLKKAEFLNLSANTVNELKEKVKEILESLINLENYKLNKMDIMITDLSKEDLKGYFVKFDNIDELEKKIKVLDYEKTKFKDKTKIKEIDYDINCLKAKVNSIKQFINNEAAMKSVLKNMYNKVKENNQKLLKESNY